MKYFHFRFILDLNKEVRDSSFSLLKTNVQLEELPLIFLTTPR